MGRVPLKLYFSLLAIEQTLLVFFNIPSTSNMDSEGIYIRPEFKYSTIDATTEPEDWLPVTYSPNNYLIGSGAATPSTTSSHSALQPFEIAGHDYSHESLTTPLDEAISMNCNLLGVPSPMNYPVMELESPWAPMSIPQRNTYPTPPRQEPRYVGEMDGSSFCSDVEMTREWQSPNDPHCPLQTPSLVTWDNRCTSATANSTLEVDVRYRPTMASRSASPIYQSPPATYNSTRSSSSSKLRTAQMQHRSSAHTAGSSSKTTHNEVEKNYRNRLNGHFKQLLAKIPVDLLDANGIEGAVGQKNVTKADTLVLAAQYIKVLREQERELSSANQRLENEYERLKGEWAGIGGVMIP